jgi:hypothetical protein
MMTKDALPKQHITINQEVLMYHGIYWEPNHHKLAFFGNLKKIVEAGKKDYSNESGKNQVIIYEMNKGDSDNGFTIKTIGNVPSDKIRSFSWSGSNGIFSVFEQEGIT